VARSLVLEELANAIQWELMACLAANQVEHHFWSSYLLPRAKDTRLISPKAVRSNTLKEIAYTELALGGSYVYRLEEVLNSII